MRIFIKSSDIQIMEGVRRNTADARLNFVRQELGKPKRTKVLTSEYCQVFNLDEQKIHDFINSVKTKRKKNAQLSTITPKSANTK